MSQMIFRVHANGEADIDELNILLSQGWVVNRTVQWPSFEWTDKVFEKHICEPCVDYILEMKQEAVDSESIRVKPDNKPFVRAWQLCEGYDEDTHLTYYEVRVLYSDDDHYKWERFATHDDAIAWAIDHGLTPNLQIL